jgi:hypothetical protein
MQAKTNVSKQSKIGGVMTAVLFEGKQELTSDFDYSISEAIDDARDNLHLSRS